MNDGEVEVKENVVPVVEHCVFMSLGEEKRECAVIGVECEVICVEPGAEFLKSEDDSEQFTASGWVSSLSWIESGAGEADVVDLVVDELVENCGDAKLTGISANAEWVRKVGSR